MAFGVHQFIVRLSKMVSFVDQKRSFNKNSFLLVPEAPNNVKALVVGAEAILVSWLPPAHPNGLITQYTVYSKEEGTESEVKSHKVPPYQMSYEASSLDQNKPFEFWVTANTNIGEGQASKSIVAMPSDKVPAKIASFDDTFTAIFKEDFKLPCLAVCFLELI